MPRGNFWGVVYCAVPFILGLAGSAHFYEKSIAIAIVSVLGGVVLGILCLFVTVGHKSEGKLSIDVSKQKGELEWKIRQKEPLDTISPTAPTNSASIEDAISLCTKGREILNQHGDLDEACRHFSAAIALDDSYWEPRANMAGIHLIKGDLDDAYQLANQVKDFAITTNNDLAFSNASLIIASIIETNIDPSLEAGAKQQEYRKVVAILNEALERSPRDVVVRSAKIKAQIIGEFVREDIISEILTTREDKQFIEEFAAVLDADEELKSAFVKELSEVVELMFPVAPTEEHKT